MTRTLIAVCALACTFSVEGADLEAGKKKAAEVCAACHGRDGNSATADFPRIAGQYPDYLVKALRDYKSGARKDPVMSGFAAQLTAQEIQNLAAYFPAQKGVTHKVFALAGNASGTGPLILDADPTTDGMQAIDHPGITNVENYLEMGGRFGARIAVGQRFRLGAAFELTAENEHVITFTDAGVDLPECSGAASPSCEVIDDELVTPTTSEVNPLHVPVIDLIAHRYRTADVLNYVVGVNAAFLF